MTNVRKRIEIHEMWRCTNFDGCLSADAFDQLKRSVEVRLKQPLMRKTTLPPDSALDSSRAAASVGASCALPCDRKQVLLCALRCGCLCMVNGIHGAKEFLFHQPCPRDTKQLPQPKTVSSRAAGSGSSETPQQRIERKRQELTAVGARPRDTSVGPHRQTSQVAVVAAVLGTSVFIFDLDVMDDKLRSQQLKSKPQAAEKLPFKSEATWYKSASVHFAPSVYSSPSSPYVLVALNDESSSDGPTVIVGAFHRSATSHRLRLPWTPLETSEFCSSASPQLPVIMGFVDDNMFLAAVDATLVLYCIVSNDLDPWRLAVVGSIDLGSPVTHGSILHRTAKGQPLALVVVHNKTIVQSCALSITKKRTRGDPGEEGRASDGAASPGIVVTMELTLLNSFATHEVAVHDIDMAESTQAGGPVALAFVSLETGAVAVLEHSSMRLVHRIAYRRLETSSRLRLNVWPTHLMVALVEDDNATIYKSAALF
jgi:hypothetical protein